MIKKGIVKAAQSNGSWEGKFGVMYKYEVTVGDDTGEYSSKSQQQDKFVIGQEVDYEVTEQGNFGKKIKPVSNFQSGGGFNQKSENPDRQRMIVRQSSLKAAVDLAIAEGDTKLDNVFAKAETIIGWVMSNEKKQETPTPARKPAPAKQVEAFAAASGQESLADGDLPF